MRELQEVIEVHGRTFALASRLLPAAKRGPTVVLYAWYRRADDAVDRVPLEQQPAAVARVRGEVDAVFGHSSVSDPLLMALRDVVRAHQIPRTYFDEFVEGLAWDAARAPCVSHGDLMRYCYRVAGTVGAVVAHVLGAKSQAALRSAAHMGMAMQLTNICRDVNEDYLNGRIYLPLTLTGGLPAAGRPLPVWARPIVGRSVGVLLLEAEDLYRSGDRGLGALGWRTALAIRAARLMYAEIGARILRRGCDVVSGRVVVPAWRKLTLLASAFAGSLASFFGPQVGRTPFAGAELRYPEDVLPI